jgi:hypothetical protein
MRDVSDRSCSENKNRHLMFNKFFWKLCYLWDNVEKYGTARQNKDNNITWHWKDALCMPDNYGKNTNTYSEYVTLIAFQWQQWLCEHATMIRYTYIARLVLHYRHDIKHVLLQNI